jgi:DNA-binding NtrC family response regulator
MTKPKETPRKKWTILVVDDERSLRDSLRLILEDEYNIEAAENGLKALEMIKGKEIDLALLDIRMPDLDGMEVLRRIKEFDPEIEVIMLTAMKTVVNAVSSMKMGAYDYVTKPFDVTELLTIIKRCLERKELLKENIYLKTEVTEGKGFGEIVGQSKKMKDIYALIQQVANNDTTIMINGESGTGKELVARAIHRTSSRAKNLFVALNCAAIPENLVESELFGHERGAFTGAFERKVGKFEIASGGTLFLDEIGSLPLSMQGKLLRAIQEREIERVGGLKMIPVNVRLISASNSDLSLAIKEKTFREDLYYRLNVIPIDLPPLRDREGDIELLIGHFLERYNRDFNKNIKGFGQGVMEMLKAYRWPGNVRELQNLIERLVVLEKGQIVEADKLPPEISGIVITSGKSSMSPEEISLKEATDKFEYDFIKRAIEMAGGSKSKAAKLLGIHRNTLLKLEKKYKEE